VSALSLPLALRLALRELRGGLRGFYVFVACIALGVGAIAGVNSVASALTDGIGAEGRVILGGDIAFSLIHREATREEMQFLEAQGEVGVVATMRALAQRIDGEDQALVELKAVDESYPHGGTLLFEDGGSDGQERLALRNGTYGALAASGLLDRLGMEPGDRIRLGTEELEIRGTIASEPDRLSSGIGFGPRLMVPLEAMGRTGLVREGSLITWIYRIRMPEGANDLPAIGELRGLAREEFPEAGWSIRSRDNAASSLRRNIERFSQFLTLVGLTALVVGGVGVANAVASFIDLKRPAPSLRRRRLPIWCRSPPSGSIPPISDLPFFTEFWSR
jgi:putative ABC transport system permease protein